MTLADSRLVTQRFGAALGEKSTPALRTLLAAAARAESRPARLPQLRDMLSEFAFSHVHALARIHGSWSPSAIASRREDRFLPVVLQLEQRAEIPTAEHISKTLAGRRQERRRHLKLLEQRFASEVADLVAAISPASGSPDGREPFASWLNQSVYALAPAHRLAAAAEHDDVQQIDVPGSLDFHGGRVVGAPGSPTQRFDRWKNTATGRNVKIGVIDGEIANHPFLGGRITQGTQYTGEPWGKPQKHATMLAGLIAAAGTDYAGAAPAATITNYKVVATIRPRSAPEQATIEATLQAALDGMDIINCSFGVTPNSGIDRRLSAQFAEAVRQGVVVVKSAGNDGDARGSVSAPADAAGVIVVGACNRDGSQIAPYSGRGPTPGGNSSPDVLAPGGILGGPLLGLDSNGSGFQKQTGTSYSAALVSGLSACMLQANPHAPPADVLQWLLQLAVPVGDGLGAVLV